MIRENGILSIPTIDELTEMEYENIWQILRGSFITNKLCYSKMLPINIALEQKWFQMNIVLKSWKTLKVVTCVKLCILTTWETITATQARMNESKLKATMIVFQHQTDCESHCVPKVKLATKNIYNKKTLPISRELNGKKKIFGQIIHSLVTRTTPGTILHYLPSMKSLC